MRYLRLALACALLALVGCESTGVGNPRSELTVSIQNDLQAEPAATDPSVLLSATELRRATVVFGELRWLPCDTSNAPVVSQGPFIVDLTASQLTLPPVAVPAGGFCGFDAPLATNAPDASMQGRSILFSGVRGDGTLFIFYAAMQGTLRMRPPTGVVWDESNAAHMIFALRPHRWLSPDELNAESSDPLGSLTRVVVVDIGRHPLLYEFIRERMGDRSSLHDDLNDNGVLDDDERTGAALLGVGLPSLD